MVSLEELVRVKGFTMKSLKINFFNLKERK